MKGLVPITLQEPRIPQVRDWKSVFLLALAFAFVAAAWYYATSVKFPQVSKPMFSATLILPKPVPTVAHVTITAYHAVPGEGWGDGCTTADGTNVCPPPKGKWICAASPDLLRVIPFGSIVEVKTLGGFWSGSCEIHDRTSSRFTNRIDILIPKGVDGNLFPHSELSYGPEVK